MGVAGAQLSLGLASDEVLRLRRAREERVGAGECCVGELLEDGVLGVL